jgi:predicted acylesterase/phospholipase RssA
MEIKCGLSLCGGGVMGAAQAGMLCEAFETDKNFLPYSKPSDYWKIVAGTSIGALNGLLVALGYTHREIYDVWFKLKRRDVMRLSWKFWKSLYTRKPMLSLLKKLIYNKMGVNDLKFSELYKATGVDLIVFATVVQTGKALVFGKDYLDCSVIEAVMMSSAFPLMFPPITYEHPQTKKSYQIIDGGVLNNSPVLPLIQGKCFEITMLTIGNLKQDFTLKGYITSFKRILEFITIGNECVSMAWASYILQSKLKVYRCECPGIGPFDWNKIPELIEMGVKSWHSGPIDPTSVVSQYTTLRNEKYGLEERLITEKETDRVFKKKDFKYDY